MQQGRASRTAEHNALFRALEASRPEAQRGCDDPFARRFLRAPLAAVAALTVVPGWRELVCRLIDRRWPGVRTSVVARTAFIDEAITAALEDDQLTQAVILGAGYDSRAHRLACLGKIAVFEVDHPDTQDAKRRALQRVVPQSPEHVRYVATDFNERDLESAMLAAGFDATEPTLFLWEGVTNYLTEGAVDSTLRWCSRAAAGSVVIFTYVNRDVLTDPARYEGADRLVATLDNVGEQLTFGLDPAETAEFLVARGLVLQRDLGAADYRRLAFGAAADRMRGHEFYRVAIARTAGVG
jgi:methyltransferase (TIGR00027 family)